MTKPEIIKYNANQDVPIKLDLTTNQIIFNQDVDKILMQGAQMVKTGNQLANTDINKIDEKQMTDLNRQIRPISKIQTDYLNTRKSIKKQLRDRDDEIIKAFDDKLNQNHFDEIQSVVKKLRVLQKDFKANRANKRWVEVQKYFNAQLETYPELTQYAKDTLGNFEYYRIHHPDLVSEAKTKPVNKKTIESLNQDLYNYHVDLAHLLNSNLNSIYYQPIIEQYGAEPSTNKMLTLIKEFNVTQIKDQHVKQIKTVDQKAKTLLNHLWINNDKINTRLSQFKPQTESNADFQVRKQQLMQESNDSILDALDELNYLTPTQTIDEPKLTNQLKSDIIQNFEIVKSKLLTTTPKPNAASKPEPQPKNSHQWFLEYLQSINQTQIHDNDQIKARIIRDLYLNITDPNSIWHHHVHDNHDLIELTNYIVNL